MPKTAHYTLHKSITVTMYGTGEGFSRGVAAPRRRPSSPGHRLAERPRRAPPLPSRSTPRAGPMRGCLVEKHGARRWQRLWSCHVAAVYFPQEPFATDEDNTAGSTSGQVEYVPWRVFVIPSRSLKERRYVQIQYREGKCGVLTLHLGSLPCAPLKR